MRPRLMDGSWKEPFDPLDREGFVEANAWQATWYVPHDVQGLIDLFGGRNQFVEKLSFSFEKAQPHRFVSSHDEYGDYLNYGNQPATQVAHLFNYAGAPWLTQKWVREVKEKTFGGIDPYSGYNDDEDQGLMGALGCLMAIGLFDMRAGCALKPTYEITSPIFDKVILFLNRNYYSGDQFIIETKNNSSKNQYIQSVKLNNKKLNKPWFYHQEFAQGGILEIELGPEPNKNWGSQPEDAPPSMSSEKEK
jgi:predicted alpha-1,2-mannosidase